jgi:hypothetical protein
MTFQPGNNLGGRPKGSRNRRTQEIFDIFEARGDKDPIDVLSDLITHTSNEKLKVQACNILAPYKHSKRSTAPTPWDFSQIIFCFVYRCEIRDHGWFFDGLARNIALGTSDPSAALVEMIQTASSFRVPEAVLF